MFSRLSKGTKIVSPILRQSLTLNRGVGIRMGVGMNAAATTPVRFKPVDATFFYSTYRTFNNGHGKISEYKSFWERHWKKIAIVSIGISAFIGTHMERAPISNRLRFMLVSKRLENSIGEQGYQEVLAQYKGHILPDSHPDTRRVKRIMKRIIEVSGLESENMDWRVHVISDPKAPPNAFVLPSGKVFVFTSILPIAENDDGLATVLSHETAHVLLRHSAESLSKAPFLIVVNLILLYAFSIRLDALTTVLFELPSSRDHEKEADFAGLIMLARACFNINEATTFWKRMASFEQSQGIGRRMKMVPELLSTHPATKNRIENMENWMPQAEDERIGAGCEDHQDSFKSFVTLFHSGRDERFF